MSQVDLHTHRHREAERYLACSFIMPREAAPQHIVFYSGVAWRWIRNPSLFLHVFFLYEHTLIILILHPPSGPIGPAGVRGSAYAASFSLHKGITVTRWRVLNLLPSLYDFFFPFQEEIFHLEPGKVESGKGKCSYDPKLNSVSALISKYHLGLVTWDCRHRHGPAQFLLATAVSSHMDSSSFLPFLLI